MNHSEPEGTMVIFAELTDQERDAADRIADRAIGIYRKAGTKPAPPESVKSGSPV